MGFGVCVVWSAVEKWIYRISMIYKSNKTKAEQLPQPPEGDFREHLAELIVVRFNSCTKLPLWGIGDAERQ